MEGNWRARNWLACQLGNPEMLMVVLVRKRLFALRARHRSKKRKTIIHRYSAMGLKLHEISYMRPISRQGVPGEKLSVRAEDERLIRLQDFPEMAS